MASLEEMERSPKLGSAWKSFPFTSRKLELGWPSPRGARALLCFALLAPWAACAVVVGSCFKGCLTVALISLTDRRHWKYMKGIRKQLAGEANKSSSHLLGLAFFSESWLESMGKSLVGYCGSWRVSYLSMPRALWNIHFFCSFPP